MIDSVRRSLDFCYSALKHTSVSQSVSNESPVSPDASGPSGPPRAPVATCTPWADLDQISAWLVGVEASLAHHMERIGVLLLDHPGIDARASIDLAQSAFLNALKVDLTFLDRDDVSLELFAC